MSSSKTKKQRKGGYSEYMGPIVGISVLVILAIIVITLCFKAIFSTETPPPQTIDERETKAAVPSESVTKEMSEEGTNPTNPSVSVDPALIDVPQTAAKSETTSEKPVTLSAPITQATSTNHTPNTTKTLAAATEKPVTTGTPVPGGFKADLSALEPYIDPQGDKWDDAYLMLVNVDHKLQPDQEKSYPTLGSIKAFSTSKDYAYRYRTDLTMNENAMRALSAMFTEAEANGIADLDVTSGYRSYSRQQSVFQSNCNQTRHWLCSDDGCSADWIAKESVCPICGKKTTKTIPITQEEIEANVATYSCAPGTSDHQTGLAVDIVQTSLPSKYLYLIQEFGETDAGKWLAENSWKFGFVLRFPPDKEDITGIIYEPWHFRFVGRTHAAKMHELNMCLEEYVDYLNQTGYFN